ncbi:hypothetical protein B0H16DRAFT_1459891 [Mycena metata]|uniref:Uncharacterized protein n=1 Tax=Mycena metata TaxID=1033252 RepID=A0AAD7IZ13_9AGAR|nr:hypothetical protein B0H16DRAFT_1459891 [Mycena metata]
MLDHYQKGDNRSCSDSVDSPKKIKTWQWHRLETDENPGGQVPKEGVAVDKECGKLKGKRVSGGEHSGFWRTDQYFCGDLKLWSGSNKFIKSVPVTSFPGRISEERLDDKIGSELLKLRSSNKVRLTLLLVRAWLEVADGTERGPGSSVTLTIRGKDRVDGGILEMALIHRSWAQQSGLPGKIFEAEWEGRRHYNGTRRMYVWGQETNLREIQWESRKKHG